MQSETYCQSCGMPMSEESHFGKNTDGSKNEDYCCHCYPNGAFINPNETLEEMIETCVPFMVEGGVCPDIESANKMLSEHLPMLKRWKKQGELISFKLKEGVSAADFLAASDEVQENYLSKRQGFLNRQLMLSDDTWTDWVIWETMADAENAMAQSMENESAMKFCSFIGEIIEQKLYPLERSY